MIKHACLLALFGVLSTPLYAQEVCQYYAMGGCFLSQENAYKRAAAAGGQVISADEHKGFTPGYFCVITGPYFSQRAASRGALRYQMQGVADAYVKTICRDYEAQD